MGEETKGWIGEFHASCQTWTTFPWKTSEAVGSDLQSKQEHPYKPMGHKERPEGWRQANTAPTCVEERAPTSCMETVNCPA